jgi:hypothetical protein
MVPFEAFNMLIQESYDAKLEGIIKVAKKNLTLIS